MIQKSEVERVAKLARLKLSDREIKIYREQLEDILDSINILQKVDTDGVEPMTHVISIHNVFRKDAVKESLDPDVALSNAPERENSYFKTPKIKVSD